MATLASGVRPDEYLPPGRAVALVVEARTPWQLFWSRFRTDRAAVAGLVTIAILVMLAVAAPLVSGFVGHGPNQLFGNMTTALGLPRGPSSQFWFGADSVGRDVFVRTIYGARTSLTVAFLATGAATLIGVTLGLVAGFFRGWVDTAIRAPSTSCSRYRSCCLRSGSRPRAPCRRMGAWMGWCSRGSGSWSW
jgi:peptide/nickel transport system permease protein